MYKASFLLAMFLACPLGAQVEEPAPTPNRCRTDAALWATRKTQNDYAEATGATMRSGIPNQNEINLLPIKEIMRRETEMIACTSADSQSLETYMEGAYFYHRVRTDRYIDFVFRHGLIQQFLDEDAAGKR
jgi:hypothetical protein